MKLSRYPSQPYIKIAILEWNYHRHRRRPSGCPVRLSSFPVKTSNLPDKCPMTGANLQPCDWYIYISNFNTNKTTYGHHKKKLNAFHLHSLPRITGINWWDKITNKGVLSCADSCSLLPTLQIWRMRRLGHLRRMPHGRLPKDILYGELCTGSRPRGQPMLRFKDVAKRDLEALDIDTERWEEVAEDRTRQAGGRMAWKTGDTD